MTAIAPLTEGGGVSALDARTRIVRQARTHVFSHGYRRCTMDDLAADLGMSKKTLYLHFATKDDLVAAVIDDVAAELRSATDALLADRRLGFAEKLHAFIEQITARMAALTPHALRDLERFAPHLYTRIEQIREKNVPYIFGRLIAEGQAAGLVRDNVSAPFAIEFFLHAVQGLLHPASLERGKRTPREAIASAIELFFGGLLTPAGRRHYEKISAE